MGGTRSERRPLARANGSPWASLSTRVLSKEIENRWVWEPATEVLGTECAERSGGAVQLVMCADHREEQLRGGVQGIECGSTGLLAAMQPA